MATSETVPFSKSGGLADVVGALSFALAEKDVNISVFMPLYGSIDSSKFNNAYEFNIPMLNKTQEVKVLKQTLNNVTFYALQHPLFSERMGIYGDTSFTPYVDNTTRFSLFCLATIELAKQLETDIIHCHDWTTGLIPYLVKQQKLTFKTIMTIHNLAYQGDYSKYDFLFSGIYPSPLCFTGKGELKRFNMLKTGIETADFISTVSPTYAKEIQEKELGCGLNELLKSRKNNLCGIINGIDINEWNSQTDPNFTQHFSSENASGKAKLKAEVQAEYGLEVNPEIPLIGMISRLADQKGFYELLEGEDCALEEIAQKQKVQFLIIGTGDSNFENKLLQISERQPNVCVKILFSNRVAHRVEGASDFFLMPSRYEPCGLNQLYSLRYGTLPIARRTGGLADSIIDISENSQKGTGFLFDEMNRAGIIEVVTKAVAFFKDEKVHYLEAQRRAMNRDSSWTASALEYLKLYNAIFIGGER